jgi:hypothetical protein
MQGHFFQLNMPPAVRLLLLLCDLCCCKLPPLSPQAPALAWDEKLAASAKAWAATCQFAVSGTQGVAEGLGFGYSCLAQAVQDWYAQVGVCAVQWQVPATCATHDVCAVCTEHVKQYFCCGIVVYGLFRWALDTGRAGLVCSGGY